MAQQSAETEEERLQVNSEGNIDLRKCTDDFAAYCEVDITKEAKTLEDNVEEMLAKLDEFSHLADTIRNDSSQILFVSLPELCAKCQALPAIFNKIDQLEVFIQTVEKSLDELEVKVEDAEEELGSHTIQKVLSSIPYLGLIQKKPPPPPAVPQTQEWLRPEIFKTSDFFGRKSEQRTLDSTGITTQLTTNIESGS